MPRLIAFAASLALAFSLLLLAPTVLADPARAGGALFDAGAGVALFRAAVLAAFNMAIAAAADRFLCGRFRPDGRLLAMGAACGALAAFGPAIADAATAPVIAALPAALRTPAVMLGAALAQGTLWAETYFATGIAIDALAGRRPSVTGAGAHVRRGAQGGLLYGALAILIVHLASALAAAFGADAHRWTVPLAALAGAALYPFVRTIVESHDAARPFPLRLAEQYARPVNAARGAVLGALVALAAVQGLPEAGGWTRFLAGALCGAITFAGVDIAGDTLARLRRGVKRAEGARAYLVGALAGGALGGVIGWYLDAAQLARIGESLALAATVNYAQAGMPVQPFLATLISGSWNVVDLGPAQGGARLLYNQSLFGVISWAIAAPLFSLNYRALEAIVQRDLRPLRSLFTQRGLIALCAHMLQVQRWGLWMAPVISAFLRPAPDPTWYNQDGAIRTLAAAAHSAIASDAAFRAWSLETFAALLAFEWFRILVWLDHMGLRVATLVNATFVAGDALEAKAARYLGRPVRARGLPEGVRRLSTWAPLTLPFYMPAGAEWAAVWDRAQTLQADPVLPAAAGDLIALYAAAFFVAAFVAVLVARSGGRGGKRYALTNGALSFDMDEAGNGHTRLFRPGSGELLHLTKACEDQQAPRGKFIYVRDLDAPADATFTLTPGPRRDPARKTRIAQTDPRRLTIRTQHEGLDAEAAVELLPGVTAERWTVTLRNLENRARRVELVSYQEPALAPPELTRRFGPFHALHLETVLLPQLGALLFRNRLLKGPRGAHVAPDVSFHAVAPGANARHAGVHDTRARFFGAGTPADPDSAPFEPAERGGKRISFDPCGAHRIEAALPPGGTATIVFLDGYAADWHAAAALIARETGRPAPDAAEIDAATGTVRAAPAPDAPPDHSFDDGGRTLTLRSRPPRPWAHPIVNPLGHGALCDSHGGVSSFAANAQRNGLTPWTPDSVTPPAPGQAVYLRDEETGAIYSAGFAPCRRSDTVHTVTFAPGAAVYRAETAALVFEVTCAAAHDAPVELREIRIVNRGPHTLRCRVVPYFEMTLGEHAAETAGKVSTAAHGPRDAVLLFRNPENEIAPDWAFAAVSQRPLLVETERARFIGGEHDLSAPAFVAEGAGDLGAPRDGRRCAAFACLIEIAPGHEATLVAALGQAPSAAEARSLAERFAEPTAARIAIDATRRWWRETLDVLTVETDAPEADRLINIWLPYQALSARLWARCGPDQRAGAYGFRDQLQDVLPFCGTHPAIARRQILLHARQQFRDGSVFHWWHMTAAGATGLGARTRASDVHVWLPYVAASYIAASGDAAILDEGVPFLDGPDIPSGEQGFAFVPLSSADTAPLFEHCRRALDLALSRLGLRGLPLMGAGDWNDGFSALGAQGRGESVWLGMFLRATLLAFAPLCEARGENALAARYRMEAERLKAALGAMQTGDRFAAATTDSGALYAPAYALTAAWPVLSDAVPPARGAAIVQAALAALERPTLMALVSPPYDETADPYPGRIAEYPKGVRENGGQYTHAVSWMCDALMALAAALPAEQAALQAQAARLWRKGSPLDHAARPAYGLAPHQQPADVYNGPGYEGRGGWSWYTGSAARMLCSARTILGVRVADGGVRVAPLSGPDAPWRLKRVIFRGRTIYEA